MKVSKVLKYILLVYLVLCGIFYFYQNYFFFHPKALPANHIFSFPKLQKYNTVRLPFDSATVIDVVRFLPDLDTPKGVVLFFHGNRFNVEHYASYAGYFTRLGYECWMPDYPGLAGQPEKCLFRYYKIFPCNCTKWQGLSIMLHLLWYMANL